MTAVPHRFVIALLGLLTGACTNLQVYKVDGVTHLPDTPGSIPYALPKKTFLISVTYVLTKCETTKSPVGLVFEADATISVVQSNEVDEEERYFIPYEKLRSWVKEINFAVESYPNQTLKSFNGTINDQAGSILTAAIGTAIKFSALADVSAEKPAKDFCEDKTLLALRDLAVWRERLDEIVKAPLSDGTTRPQKEAAKPIAKPEPGNPNAKPDTGKPGSQDALIAEVVSKINKIIAGSLTSKVVLTWSPQVSDLRTLAPGRDAATKKLTPDHVAKKWLTAEGQAWLGAHPDNVRESQTKFIVLDIPAWSHPPLKEQSSSVTEGLVIRNPALGVLRVCNGPCPAPDSSGVVSVDNVAWTFPNVVLPQLGRKLVLPLENGFAQNSALEMAMSEDGVITKISVKNASTLNSTLTGLGANAEAAKSAIDAREKAKAAALTAAQNKARDDNKVLSDCLEAQKNIVKNGGTPIGSCQ